MILLTPNLFLNIFSIFFDNLIQINPFIHILFKIFTRFSLAWTAAISLVGNLQIRKKILTGNPLLSVRNEMKEEMKSPARLISPKTFG